MQAPVRAVECCEIGLPSIRATYPRALYLTGIDAGEAVEVIAVSRLPGTESYNVVYRRRDGQTGFLTVDAATNGIAVVDPATRLTFDADPAAFRLALEAHRIRRAYLFDPMLAVHASLVEPLPHQITAVYGELLTRQPLAISSPTIPAPVRRS